MNQTVRQIFSGMCTAKYSTYNFTFTESNQTFCEAIFDGVLCWPPTKAGSKALMQCPQFFSGYNYNKFEKAERYCHKNGIWQNKTNYDPCYYLNQDTSLLFWTYIIGYSLSFISLCTALAIFIHYKSLRCLRNIIHSNLIVSFIIRVILWVLIYASTFSKPWPRMLNNIIFAMHISSQLSNFFWMFVEGLYLFIVIVWTYKIDKVKIWHFAIFGWALPVIITLLWIISIVSFNIKNWVNYRGSLKLIVNLPIIIILLVNVVVLVFIVFTLINKLKATNNVQSKNRRTNQFGPLSLEYKKALKSTIVLMPLLGFSHIIFIINPPKNSRFTIVFQFFNAILSSSQGFWVSMIYCFFNSEVRSTLRNHIMFWKNGEPPHFGRSRNTMVSNNHLAGCIQQRHSLVNMHKFDSNDNSLMGVNIISNDNIDSSSITLPTDNRQTKTAICHVNTSNNDQNDDTPKTIQSKVEVYDIPPQH